MEYTERTCRPSITRNLITRVLTICHVKLTQSAVMEQKRFDLRSLSPALHSFVILGDPGAVSRVDKMFVVKVYCKIETSPWALTLTEPVLEAFELPAFDWPEKFFSGQSAKRSCRVTLVFSYTT